MPPLPADLLARFALQHEVGSGSLGRVFRARQTAPDRLVALKVITLNAAFDEADADRVSRERHALARLQHPNIVIVFESGVVDSCYFIAMELARGSLRGELATMPRSDIVYGVQRGREILAGLSAAHAAGILHRDMKPENTLVLPSDEGTTLKLADFALARAVAADRALPSRALASAGSAESPSVGVAGTPPYIAPECWRGEPQSAASDVFAAGVMLYEIFGGRRPFPSRHELHQQADVIVRHVPPPLRTLNPAVPEAVASVVDSMLEKDPHRRSSAADADRRLADAVE